MRRRQYILIVILRELFLRSEGAGRSAQIAALWRRDNCALGSLPYQTAPCPIVEELVQRFLRWILPLKESSLTDDAAFPIVPAKALPALAAKEV